MIILVLVMAVPSMTVIPKWPEGFQLFLFLSFCRWPTIEYEPSQTMRCLSSRIAFLISSAVIQSGISVHGSISLNGYVHAWYFFISTCFMVVPE